MTAKNYPLPDFIIAGLFKEQLVVVEEMTLQKKQPSTTVTIANQPPSFLGDNKKYITIIVYDKDAVHLKDESLQFLQAILAACKLNLGDIAIVNKANNNATYQSLKTEFQPNVLLVFGLTAEQLILPFTVPLYQLQDYDQCKILFVPDFNIFNGATQEAKLEKSKLWLSLKKAFNLT